MECAANNGLGAACARKPGPTIGEGTALYVTLDGEVNMGLAAVGTAGGGPKGFIINERSECSMVAGC